MNKNLLSVNETQLSPQLNALIIEIYGFCASICPQFYTKKTDLDIKREMAAMGVVLKPISPEIIIKMCELAALDYPKVCSRSKNRELYTCDANKYSRNEKVVFDFEYILSFYEDADYLVRKGLNSYNDLYDDLNTLVVGVE